MKKIVIIILLFVSIFTLAAQSLPADLDAAVQISISGTNKDLVNTMMDYKNIEKTNRLSQKKQLAEDYKERDAIKIMIEKRKIDVRNKKIESWGYLITSAIFGGASAYFAEAGSNAYDNYLDATISSDAVTNRYIFQAYDTLSYVSLGAAGLGTGMSIASFIGTPSLDDLNNKLIAIDKKIEFLEGVLQ